MNILLQAATTEVTTGFRSLAVPAQVLIAILPLVAVIMLSVLLFFTLMWEFKKKKMLIEKGQEHERPLGYEKLFLLGIVSFCIGAGLVVFFALNSGISSSLLGGIIPAMAGLGIIIFYGVRKT